MCNPVAIGLVVAGTALQMNAQSRRQAAMQDAAKSARQLESTRQEGLRNEREGQLLASEQGQTVDAQNAALADAAAKREAAYTPAAPASDPSTSYNAATDNGAPKIIAEDAASKRGAAQEEVSAVGNARARLGSYSDVNLGNRITNSNYANQIGMLGGFARGSAALLPGEVASAMQSKAGTGRNQELIGTALSLYGSAGAPGAGGAAFGAGASAGATGQYGAALNSGTASTVGGLAPSSGYAAAGQGIAQSAFPGVAQASAAPGGLAGLFANGASSLYANGGRAFGALLPAAFQQRRNAQGIN